MSLHPLYSTAQYLKEVLYLIEEVLYLLKSNSVIDNAPKQSLRAVHIVRQGVRKPVHVRANFWCNLLKKLPFRENFIRLEIFSVVDILFKKGTFWVATDKFNACAKELIGKIFAGSSNICITVPFLYQPYN